jgi:hypothetical protein
MVELYMLKGMSQSDAELVIKTMAKYKDFFVDIMMTQELQLQYLRTIMSRRASEKVRALSVNYNTSVS